MSSADEVALVDTMNGTSLNAGATACAKVVVDGREIILYGDSAVRTGLLTLHTADTAVGAILTGVNTLILVGALNNNAGGVIDEVDDTVGTLAYADAAADTLSGINLCYAIVDGDSALRTNYRAVAVAEAGEGTVLVTAVCHICGTAGLVALVVALSGSCVTGAVAGNVSNLFYNVLSINTEDSGDLLSGGVTAGNTEVGLVGSLFGQSLCIAVTARVSAGAAVGAGQTVTDSEGGLVLLNSEEYAG